MSFKKYKKYTYCSFAQDKFLGGLFLPGEMDVMEACQTAWALKLNPGGEVMCIVFAAKSKEQEALFAEHCGRLLTKEDMQEFDRRMEPLMKEDKAN